MTSAIFVFADGCGSCTAFKAMGVYEEVKKLYRENGVKIFPELVAPNIRDGLSLTGVHRAFHYIRFFPAVILLPTKVADDIHSYTTERVLSVMKVFNGVVSLAPLSIRLHETLDFMLVQNYMLFLRSFRPETIAPPAKDTQVVRTDPMPIPKAPVGEQRARVFSPGTVVNQRGAPLVANQIDLRRIKLTPQYTKK